MFRYKDMFFKVSRYGTAPTFLCKVNVIFHYEASELSKRNTPRVKWQYHCMQLIGIILYTVEHNNKVNTWSILCKRRSLLTVVRGLITFQRPLLYISSSFWQEDFATLGLKATTAELICHKIRLKKCTYLNNYI